MQEWERVAQQVQRKPWVARYQDDRHGGMLLLHLACALHPSETSIKIIIEANPAATSHADSKGRVPLHIVMERVISRPYSLTQNCFLPIIRCLIINDPDTIDLPDCDGQTAIHYAFRGNVHVNFLHLFLQMKPAAARREFPSLRAAVDSPRQLDKTCTLAVTAHCGTPPVSLNHKDLSMVLHAVLARDFSTLVLQTSMERYGLQYARTKDEFGDFPIHYAVSSKNVSDGIVASLLFYYPQCAATRNSKGHLPLHQTLKHRCKGVKELFQKFPAAVQELDPETKLPVALLAAMRGNVGATYFLLREHPQIVASATILET